MKLTKVHRVIVLIFAVIIAGIFITPVYADSDGTHPYFTVNDGDVFAGGWFDSGNAQCSTADPNYQAPTFNPLTNQNSGGILAFANGRQGSSTGLAAFSMGIIDGEPSNDYGFYTGQTSSTNGLSFANSDSSISSNYEGGYFAGATQQIHCVPDYFGTKQNAAADQTSEGASFNVGSIGSGQFTTPAGQTVDIVNGGPATIAAGQQTTVFVDGNAYISHNITYASGYTSDNVPKLAIVVKGDIFIDPSVTNLDGLYIAQPSTGSQGGNIWTCHDSDPSIPDGYWVRSNCGSQLTINGAVIAKQVNFLRTNGDLGGAPAEIINYTPAMVIGGAFFNQTTSQTARIDSLISLPPVF